MDHKTKAERFAALHGGEEILVLPNAWDAASAAVLEDAGARAVATSSAAVAWTHGYADGDALPLDKLLASIAAVCRAVAVPVTADIEGGYTDDLVALGETVRAVIAAGAVGINLEDGRREADLHARKVATARQAADAAGVPLFINARIDVYLKRLVDGEAAFAETTRRAALYAEAGADGIFVPGPTQDELIARLSAAIARPLNVLVMPGLAAAGRLQALGVRRLSAGSAPFRTAYGQLASTAAEYLRSGSGEAFTEGAVPLANLNTRFSRAS
jgi:2-methylisocitrate lyase-like PEP mutase family enzyme